MSTRSWLKKKRNKVFIAASKVNSASSIKRRGYTLVELIVTLTILSIMAAIVIPSLAGFIDKAREKSYVMEAQGVRKSMELYLIDHYDEEVDAMLLLLHFTSTDLSSPKNPLADYLTLRCTKGAVLEGITVDASTREVVGIIYRVAGRRIEIDGSKVTIEKIN